MIKVGVSRCGFQRLVTIIISGIEVSYEIDRHCTFSSSLILLNGLLSFIFILESKFPSRHSTDPNANSNKYKRCIECNKPGHFKCSTECEGKNIKLTFKVEDNLDEFLFSEIDHNINYTVETTPTGHRKRSHKLKYKKQKHRRLPDSNIMIPVNNDEELSSESSSSSDNSQSQSHSESDDRSYSSDEDSRNNHQRGSGRRSGHKQGRSHSNRV